MVLLALAATPALALDPTRLPSQYVATTWREELPQATVRAVVQDRNGYLWLGTQSGLARFDGVRFELYEPAGTPELGAGDIRALTLDGEGRLWIGTRGGGLTVFDGERFRRPAGTQELGFVYALASAPDGAMWVGTRGGGLWRLQGERAERFDFPDGPEAPSVFSLLAEADGGLWAGLQNGGLWRLEAGQIGSGRLSRVAPATLAAESIYALTRDRQGHLWVGTRSLGLVEVRPDGTVQPLPETAGPPVTSILEDRQGLLWAGSYGRGLFRLHDGASARLGSADGLPGDSVMALFEDREGSLWIGTEGSGLGQLRDGAFRTYGPPEGLPAEQVWAVLQDRAGTLWLGTDGGGLAALRGERIERPAILERFAKSSVTTLHQATDGALWFGLRDDGLWRLDGTRLERFGAAQGLASETVFALAEDASGTLWAGTVGKGLFRRPPGGAFEAVGADQGLADDRVWVVVVGFDGEILIGTDGEGLKIWQDGKLRVIGPAEGLPAPTVTSIHPDADGTVWVGTYGGGLARLDANGLKVLSRREGLADDVILQIVDDEKGSLWLSSNKGVARVAKLELEAFARGERASVTAVSFGKADGMRSAEANGAFQPAGIRGWDGRVWFPTTRGVVTVDPTRLAANTVAPGVVIEAASADGRSLLADRGETAPEPTLAPGTERLELAFTGLSFVEPEAVRFRYQLEGFDRSWIDAGSERRATYTNLPTGRSYRFRVQAANNDGVWSPEGAALAFLIRPHLYQQPWFLLTVATALAALGWLAYQLRVRQLLHRTRQLEGLVAERTAEVVAQRDQLRTTAEELAELNRFKSEFLGIAAHDLKNPLAVIYGYAGLMLSKAEVPPSVAKVARRIGASSQRMLGIISDLLDTTAIESGKIPLERTRTDLGEVLGEVAEAQRLLAADREAELVIETTGDLVAELDREKVRRILENLVGNAIRYTRPKTTVTLRARELAEAGGGRRLRIEVEDQGPGIPASQASRLFQRFERLSDGTPRPADSTGLGLAIVRQFVELHEGKVWVESEVGQGSRFLVEVPA